MRRTRRPLALVLLLAAGACVGPSEPDDCRVVQDKRITLSATDTARAGPGTLGAQVTFSICE